MDNTFEELLQDFLLESRERLDTVEELLLALGQAGAAEAPGMLDRARRELHTLKGNSGMMGFADLQSLAHEIEDQVESLDPARPAVGTLLDRVDRLRGLLRQAGRPEDATADLDEELQEEASQELALGGVRVPFSELDGLVEMLAEVLLYRTRLADAAARARGTLPPGDQAAEEVWEELENVRLSLEKNLDFVQDQVLQLRMVPLQSLFRHLNRIVFDESAKEGKTVRLETTGGDTPLDKALLELASEALGHLVRNAVIHGIEPAAERRKAGKPEEGRVRLAAFVHGQEVHIEVTDDGAGVDRERLREVAASLGLSARTDAEVDALLFRSGVTTKKGADLSAGRGVGLAAVAESVRRRGGRVEVSSDPGTGTRFLLRLPLSVSITRALLLRADGEEYALPLGVVVESLRLELEDDQQVHRASVYRWRERILPMVDLGLLLSTSEEPLPRRFVVVLEALGQHRALAVDEITGIRDIVVKGLDDLLGSPPGVSGSTILGDGRVILILDPSAIAIVGSGERVSAAGVS